MRLQTLSRPKQVLSLLNTVIQMAIVSRSECSSLGQSVDEFCLCQLLHCPLKAINVFNLIQDFFLSLKLTLGAQGSICAHGSRYCAWSNAKLGCLSVFCREAVCIIHDHELVARNLPEENKIHCLISRTTKPPPGEKYTKSLLHP